MTEHILFVPRGGGAPAGPELSVAPVIGGAANVGRTLSISAGTWSGTPSIAYQWRRDGTPIGGATNSNYLLVPADAGAAISCAVTASEGGDDTTVVVPAGTAAYDTDVAALFAAITSPPSSADRGHMNTLILALKDAGVWPELDALWILAAQDEQAALLNWRTPGTFNLAKVGAPTFEQYKGFTGNGSSQYLDPSINLATGVRLRCQSSNAHISAWSLTSATGTNDGIIGSGLGAGQSGLRPFSASGTFAWRLQSSATDFHTHTNSRGYFLANRVASGDCDGWINGAKHADGTAATAVVGSAAFIVLGAGTSLLTTKQISMASLGGSLTPTQITAFYNALLTYMQAVGAV